VVDTIVVFAASVEVDVDSSVAPLLDVRFVVDPGNAAAAGLRADTWTSSGTPPLSSLSQRAAESASESPSVVENANAIGGSLLSTKARSLPVPEEAGSNRAPRITRAMQHPPAARNQAPLFQPA